MSNKKPLPTWTLSSAARALHAETISIRELRKDYTRLRDAAVKRVQRIEASDVPFMSGEKPAFPKLAEIGNDRAAFLRELGELSKFIHSADSTVTARKARRDKWLQKMNARYNFNIRTDLDKTKFFKFMEWFHESALSILYDSDSEEVEELWTRVKDRKSTNYERIYRKYVDLDEDAEREIAELEARRKKEKKKQQRRGKK